MMKYVVRSVVLCLIIVLCLPACVGREEELKPEESIQIYYMNADNNGLVPVAYARAGKTTDEEIQNVLSLLKSEPDSIDMKSTFQKNTKITDWELEETKLKLYFAKGYYELDPVREILLRASAVLSLVQIEKVDYVAFYVEEEPLMVGDDVMPGFMNADSFVQNVGASLNTYDDITIRLYFGNEQGKQLVPVTLSTLYNGNTSVEKLIVTHLMAGPQQKDLKATIPAGAKLLSVSTKSGICYVNFDEGFLDAVEGVTPKATIYSIVNSLTDNQNVSQVQILINGESNILYQEQIDLKQPFGREEIIPF